MKRPIFLAIVIALLLTAQHFVSSAFITITPIIQLSAVDYDMDAELGLTTDDLGKLRGRVYTYEKTAVTYIGFNPVSVTATNESFALLNEITLIRGGFFGKTAADLGQNYAVIGEDLSFALFKTKDSLGNTLDLNGLRYTVCGVYSRDSLMESLSSDGTEVIYIPGRSDFDRIYMEQTVVHRVCLIPDEATAFAADEFVAALGNISLKVSNYTVKDMVRAGQIIGQFARITYFALAILLIILLAEALIRGAAAGITFLQEKLDTQSIGAIFDEHMIALLLAAIGGAAVVFLCVIVYRAAAFDLYIPGKYVPPNRILDFAYYRDLVGQVLRERNIYYAQRLSGYSRLHSFLLWFNLAATTLAVGLSAGLFSAVRKYIKEKFYGKRDAEKSA